MKIEKSSNIVKVAVEAEGVKDVGVRWLISKDDGAENFAMRMFELQPGGHTPLHKHEHEHEVFVLEGQGTFIFEGQEHPFSPEYVIFVPAGSEHQFKNTGDYVMRMLGLIPASAV